MSRTETALKPLVANNSSAAARIASRIFGLRRTDFLLGERETILFVLMYKRSGPVNNQWRQPGVSSARDPAGLRGHAPAGFQGRRRSRTVLPDVRRRVR